MELTNPALDRSTAAIVILAASAAVADREAIGRAVAAAMAADLPAVAIDELVLQSILTIGWPRALVIAEVWRAASNEPATGGDDGLDYADHLEWSRRGEATCRIIYGDSYDKLRRNVRRLHPALESWMIVEGYGRTLSRPGLDLGVRELCTVAQIAVLDAPRQLHSHLLGALRAGASVDAIDATLELVRPMIDPRGRTETDELWRTVRSSVPSGS
ncbi:MAG TPA: carboxymuconolactone decarboxylase family protein [Gemmatimonadales bacterium]|jgi:4-carboxymuconolactone decarboxylase